MLTTTARRLDFQCSTCNDDEDDDDDDDDDSSYFNLKWNG